MAITTKKPSYKQTVGAQYVCFDKMDENKDWAGDFEADVIRTDTVKNIDVNDNSSSTTIYASGNPYGQEDDIASKDITVEVIAFSDQTLAKMKGDTVTESGAIISNRNGIKPYFAYGKVVKLSHGKRRYEWFGKCQLVSNTDKTSTSTESFSEQTDTITIRAYPLNDGTYGVSTSADVELPATVTEDTFFAAPLITEDDYEALATKTKPNP